MNKPVYTNEFDKPVYAVTHLHVKKPTNSDGMYELQLNDQYFYISERQLEAIDAATRLPDNISISMG